MIETFWEKMGEGLASQWSARSFTTAFAFWAGGLLAWSYQNGWGQIAKFLQAVDPVTGIALLIAGVFLLAVSSSLIDWLTLPILRVAEGYWPSLLNVISNGMIERVNKNYKELRLELKQLNEGFQKDTLDREQTTRFARVDTQLDNLPVDARLRLPTRVGNILRAAEEYPNLYYGLETSITWPRLWLLLPECTQKEIIASRQALNESAQLLAWGIAFIVWVVFAWWAFIPGVFVAVAAYVRMQAVAGVYAQMLRSAYDLHRFELYKSVFFKLPNKPDLEKIDGQALTQYLKRHITSPEIYFLESNKE